MLKTGVFLVLSFWSIHLALSQKLIFDKISTEQGLSQASGTSFAQDNQGYLWIGTIDGLNRFDGNKFEQFYRDHENDTTTIPNNSIADLKSDSKGFIWVGTSSGLCRYNPGTGRFESSSSSRALDNINGLYLDNDENIWVLRDNHITILSDLNQVKFTIDVVANEVIQVGEDMFWIGTEEGIFSFDLKMGISTPILTGHLIHELEFKNSTLWIATNKGLYKTEDLNDTLKPIIPLVGKNCRQIEFDIDNNLWVATDEILILNTDNLTTKTVSSANSNPYGLSNSNVLSMFRDRDGGMWLGTDGFGINYYNPVKVYITHLNNIPHDENSLPSPFVKCIFENAKGNIWIGTLNGLSNYNPHGSHFTNYSENSGLLSNTIQTINHWNNQLVIGTDKGINLKVGYGFKAVFPALKGKSVTVLYSVNSHLWIGSEDGLYHVNSPGIAPVQITDIENEVTALKFDSAGYLWCGTTQGLFKIKGDSVVANYTSQAKNFRTLYSNFVKSIEFDNRGRMWVGTKEGLSLYHSDSDDFTTITKTDGLPNDLIYGILTDDSGKLWLSTNNGICQYDPDSLIFRKFTTDDNLQSKEFNSGAYHEGISGFMYFGGINGLNIFSPSLLTQKVGSPLTNITDIELFHQPIMIGEGEILKKHPSVVDSITLNYNQNTLTLRFTSINFINPKNARYRYKLKNFNSDWVETPDPVAQFTNLNPGTYQFFASSAGRDYKWSDLAKPITIIITPPLWQYLSFQISLSLFILLLVIGLYRWRISTFKKNQRRLEMLVQERTEEIAAQNEELRQQTDTIHERNMLLNDQKQELHHLNQDLELKVEERTQSLSQANKDLKGALTELDLFIYRSSHDLRGPVATLLGLTSIMKMKTSKKEALDVSEKVVITTDNLNKTLDKLLTINVINRDVKKGRSLHLRSFITEIANNFQHKSGSSLNKVDIVIPENLHITTDSGLLEIILNQLFSNSSTFTNGNDAEVHIEAKEEKSSFELIFKDNGQGISNDIKDEVFQMFFRGSDQSKGNGLGLYVAKKAVKKLNGSIRFVSKEQEGTTFFLHLPKN